MKNSNWLIIILLSSRVALCQTVITTRDVGFWSGFELEKKLNKELNLAVDQQLRFFDNALKLDDYLLNTSLTYSLNNHFDLKGAIRYTHNRRRQKPTSNDWRYSVDLRYKTTLNKSFKISYRFRYQQRYENAFRKRDPSSVNSSVRHQVKLFYRKLSQLKPYLSAELFRRYEKFRSPYFNQVRFVIGSKFKLQKNKLNIGIGYEKELQEEYPLSFFYGKISYTLLL